MDAVCEHIYIYMKDPPTQCEYCQWNLTVCHILVECNKKNLLRREKIYLIDMNSGIV